MCAVRHDMFMGSGFGKHPVSDLFLNEEMLTATSRRTRYNYTWFPYYRYTLKVTKFAWNI